MRIFIASIAIATLAFAGASPAAAQSKPGTDQGVSVGVATTRDAATERSSYTQKAQEETRIWQQKLHDFDAKALAESTAAQTSAAKDLDSAWAETKTASARLESAGDKDWGSAKASFRTASAKLAVAWQKADPKDK